jgi:hypothetical protein
MQSVMFLHPLHVNSTSTWFINYCIFFLFPHLKHVDNMLTSSFLRKGFVPSQRSSLLIQLEQTFCVKQFFSMIFIILEIAQMKELGLTSMRSIYPIGNLKNYLCV